MTNAALRRLLSMSSLLLAALPATAQRTLPPPPIQPQADPARPDWENPAVFAIGKAHARTTGFPFETRALALARDQAKSARFLSLDGAWKFAFSPGVEGAPKDFYRADYDVSTWKDIKVPADWQTQGYDQPRYNNIIYPFPANRPLIPHATNPVGSYRRDVTLPAAWSGEDVILHIGAAGSAYYVWVNGKRVGYSEDSKLPSEFDVTRFVKSGRNSVSIQVYRWSDGSYLEDQDFWRVSGIERSVWMMAAPRARIADTVVTAGLANAYRDGALDVALDLTAAAKGMTARATLLDGTRQVLTRDVRVEGDTARLTATVPAVRAWTAETPNLYTLVTELVDARGHVVQSTARRIGFRDVAMLNGQVSVNGRPIMIRGVNRHEHDPETFHVISEASMRRDIELMKLNNVNALRTSHYPNDERLYELADEYGLYVMDEANIESHGYLVGNRYTDAQRKALEIGNDPAWRAAQVSRVVNMVHRDRNHPSVIFWSLGNESGVGPNFETAAAAARALDPTRLISYLGWTQISDFRPNGYADIYAPMYDGVDKMLDYAKHTDFRQPMIQCEYAHMQGNSGGNLAEYWDAIYAHPDRLQGGFIWDWVEQTVYRYTKDGRRYWGDGSSFGANPGGEIEFGDGLLQSDRTPNPQLYELAHVYAPIQFAATDAAAGRFEAINRFDFRNLSGFAIEWEVTEDGRPFAHGSGPTLKTAARTREPFSVRLPALTLRKDAEYLVTVRARAGAGSIGLVPAGHVVGWGQFALTPPVAPLPATGMARVVEAGDTVTMAAGGASLAISRTTGLVTAYSAGGRPMITGGAPHFYRAPTDNDLGTGADKDQAVWRAMSDQRRVERVTVERGVVTIGYALGADEKGDGAAARMEVAYRMAGDGRVSVDARFRPLREGLPAPLRVGLAYAMPTRVTDLAWYGRGPQDTYVDRRTGAPIGVWRGTIAAQYHDYIRPQDTGNKVDVRWMTLTEPGGRGVRVTGATPLMITALAFPYEDLYRRSPGTWRSTDVVPHGQVTLLIDGAQAGIGGDTTWNAVGLPMPQYRLSSKPYAFAFDLTAAK